MIIRGVIGSCLVVLEGPILINLVNSVNSIRFIEVEIVFQAQGIKSKAKDDSICLFKIYLSSVLEIEMCNVAVDRKLGINQTLIAFQLLKPTTTFNVSASKAITILKLISSKFSKFDRIIKSSEHSIIEMDNCLIEYCQSKMISLVNPYILKIVNSNFENNNNCGLHIKFRENLKSLKCISTKSSSTYGKSKIYLHNNEFVRTQGSAILIEGCINTAKQVSLDLLVSSCTFKHGKDNCISISDCVYSKLIIESSTFTDNYENGIFLKRNINQKALQLLAPNNDVYFKIKDSAREEEFKTGEKEDELEMLSIIRKSTFVENEGSGIVVSQMNSILIDNQFIKNNCYGFVLSATESIDKCSIYNKSESEQINLLMPASSSTHLRKCIFTKNGLSGLKVLNFTCSVSIKSCSFQENFEYGLHLENDSISQGEVQKPETLKKLESTQESEFHPCKTFDYHEVQLLSCQVMFNLKSGIYVNNRHLNIKETLIQENLKYSLELPLLIHKSLVHLDQFTSSRIEGKMGGPWGESSISSLSSDCISCLTKKSFKSSNITHKRVDSEKLVLKKENGCEIF